MRIGVAIVTLLPICSSVPKHSQWDREILASTEIPAEHIDPGSIDLTSLINTLLNASHASSEHLFSVLSVTSHSSLALHKITLLVYNISSFQDIETSMFPLRYCYCVTNKTNDLTDFTAILLDVMGNSTSYLQELFKSSSILSISQMKSSDCIYICVMAGKTDRDQPKLWDSVPPLFNQTIVEHTHTAISADFPSSSPVHSAVSVTSPSVITTTATTSYAPLTVPTTGHMAAVPSAVSITAGINTTSTTSLTTVPMITLPVRVLIPTSDNVPTLIQTLPSRTTAVPPGPPATTTIQPVHPTAATAATSSTVSTATEISISVKTAATGTSPATNKSPYIYKPGVASPLKLPTLPTKPLHTMPQQVILRELDVRDIMGGEILELHGVASSLKLPTLRELDVGDSMGSQIAQPQPQPSTSFQQVQRQSVATSSPTVRDPSQSPGTVSFSKLPPWFPTGIVADQEASSLELRQGTALSLGGPEQFCYYKRFCAVLTGCPWRSELIYRGSQKEDLKQTLDEDLSATRPTISTIKLQPCVFELCKFFSQCLCRGFSPKTSLQRYCIDSHFWYEKHTVEICKRVKRITFSKSLKQKCLAKMCVKM
ncbi:uncharacterized protein LOC124403405 [Silurus meridionalis]|uniref:uncharacterized protein LOC124403405 n=1 Tax=Silurus meridionalis TaxID=175797 RepID=UPI001EEC088C|nr:uncharacterized protein LOC124403405 [Silurus meridionalis]